MTQYNVATLSHAHNRRRRAMARRLWSGYHLIAGSFFCPRLALFVRLVSLPGFAFLLACLVFSPLALASLVLCLCGTLAQIKTVQSLTPLSQLRLDLLELLLALFELTLELLKVIASRVDLILQLSVLLTCRFKLRSGRVTLLT